MNVNLYGGEMTSQERVLCALHHQQPDRVPVNYMANPIIHSKVARALGFAKTEGEGVLKALGVDIRMVIAKYNGPELFTAPPGRRVDPVYGHIMKWEANIDGGYWDFCDFPLEDAEPEEIAAFPVPDPQDFDYDRAVAEIERYYQEGLAVSIGDAGFSDIINATGRGMGMENTLVNLMMEDEATLAYIDRRLNMELGIWEILLERAADKITFVWMGEDLGTQRGPMISMDLYHKVLKPRHQRYINLAKAYNKPVMLHSCGSSSWIFEELIKMGVDAVDTLQPEAWNMEPAYLKEKFGSRLAFHGCISTAGALAYGTKADVEDAVHETLKTMMPGGGYILAPTHAIQDNTPVENILAMYRAAHQFGHYK